MANLIYGLNATEGLTDVIDVDLALENIGLLPDDLSTIGDISNYITKTDFHHLSKASGSPNAPLSQNIIDRIQRFADATEDLQLRFESKGGPVYKSSSDLNTSSIQGNLVINGPVGSKGVRYFSTELLNSNTGEFEPLDISTSRVSSWSRSGSTLSYGGNLQVSSLSPARASSIQGLRDEGAGGTNLGDTPSLKIGKLIIDGRPQLTTITPRSFSAEAATHKLKVNINGTDYYVYAMKNIPLVFEGTFAGNRSNPIMQVQQTNAAATDYRVFTGNLFQDFKTIDSLLIYPNLSRQLRRIEVYQKPSAITNIIAPDLSLNNFPDANYINLESLNYKNNNLENVPNLKKYAPNLTSVDFRFNKFYESPANSLIKLNRFTDAFIDRFPDSVTELRIGGSLGNPKLNKGQAISVSMKRKLPNLETFEISGRTAGDGIVTNSPSLPEVHPNIKYYLTNTCQFSALPGVSQTRNFSPLVGLDSSTFGNPSKPASLRIRRALNYFRVEINSPGEGYTNGNGKTFYIDNSQSGTGAASPQGLPYGKVTVNVDDGEITSGHFSPAHTPNEWTKLKITEPQMPDGTIHTRLPHEPGEFSGYSPCGYYVDCGYFSSPSSIAQVAFNYFPSCTAYSRFDAFMNPFYNDDTINTYKFGNVSVGDTLQGATYNPSTKHTVYGIEIGERISHNGAAKNLNRINISGGALPIPFLVNNKKIVVFEGTDIDFDYTSVLEKFNKYKHVVKTLPGINTPSGWELSSLFTLYDSPQKSEDDTTYPYKAGQNGVYKFRGCSNLKNLRLSSSDLGGTFPRFDGNTSLEEVDARGTLFSRFESVNDESPVAIPLDQFVDCKDKLKQFYLTRSSQTTINTNRSSFGRNHIRGINYVGVFRRLRLPQATEEQAATITDMEEGDFPTDILGENLQEFVLRSRGSWSSREWSYYSGFTGPLPTFRRATNLKTLDLSFNSWDGNFADFTLGYQHKTLTRFVCQTNNLYGPFNLHNLANNDRTTKHVFERLDKIIINWSRLSYIENFGNEDDENSKNYIREMQLNDAFDCPRYSNSTWQAQFEPGKQTYNKKADRWLLDRRKDGTAYKYEKAIPTLKNRMPRLANLRLGVFDQKQARGPFNSFDVGGGYDCFIGTQLRYLDLRGNGFTKESIIELAKALETYAKTRRYQRSITVDLRWQRGYDSPGYSGVGAELDPLAGTGVPGLNGSTDFRIKQPSDSLETFHPQSIYRRTDITDSELLSKRKYNKIEDNDLFKRLKDTYNISFAGVLWSRIPNKVEVPEIVDLNITGNGQNELHTSRKVGNIHNLLNWVGNIDGVVTIGNIDRDATTLLTVYKIKWDGTEEIMKDAFGTQMILDGNVQKLPTEFAWNVVLDTTSGLNADVHSSNIENGYNIGVVLEEDENLTGRIQTFSIKVVVEGIRGTVQQKTTTLVFKNQEEFRTTEEETSHPRGDWKIETTE